MSSCLGSRRKSRNSADTQPLLPQYADDTTIQRTLHQKLHSYQMVKALSEGYMPSTEQLIILLRTLLSSDLLNDETPGLSDSGRFLLKYTKRWIREFIELLRVKNDRDQIQDFIWYLVHARISVDTGDIIKRAHYSRTKADISAAYESIKTVGSLLLTNSDFRLFLSDLNTIGRQVFADAANTLSNVAEDAAKQIEPSPEASKMVKNLGSEPGPPPTTEELGADTAEIGNVIIDGLKETGKEAKSSLTENVKGDQKDTLLFRLKKTVTKLRKRTDYSDSVSTIGLLIKRYAKVYSRAADRTVSTIQDDVETNEELDRAIKNGWSLMSSFGNDEEWNRLEKAFNKVIDHSQKDPEFEALMDEFANSIQAMLSDPDFFDSTAGTLDELKEKASGVGSETTLRQDIDRLTRQARRTFNSVVEDEEVGKLFRTTLRIWTILSPLNTSTNTELFVDLYSTFLPLLIQAIQYIPILRIEISVPELDLLLENLILEPGRTINNSSFFPYKLNINTMNDLDIYKARMRTVSALTTVVTTTIQGLSIRAEEVGFWLRAHKGLLKLADEGIASFELDNRGMDISIEFEVGKDRLEKILSLRRVKVRIHHLNYALRRSKFSLLAWLFKPLLRPLVKKVLERQIGTAIADGLRAANRELLYARERLRATRISDPKDLRTFIRAIVTRLTPEDNPDLYANVGITGGANERGNVFAGKYAPGSIVKLWQEEAARAGERIDDHSMKGWRNEIFDVQATMA